jgi:hypothetical protein
MIHFLPVLALPAQTSVSAYDEYDAARETFLTQAIDIVQRMPLDLALEEATATSRALYGIVLEMGGRRYV